VHLARDPRRQSVRQDVRCLPAPAKPVRIATPWISAVVAVAAAITFSAREPTVTSAYSANALYSAGTSVCSWPALAAGAAADQPSAAVSPTVRACSELELAP
jgi:hypothetical protein